MVQDNHGVYIYLFFKAFLLFKTFLQCPINSKSVRHIFEHVYRHHLNEVRRLSDDSASLQQRFYFSDSLQSLNPCLQ